ncbi:hypothetical protein ACWNXI_01910 [Caldibacillus thermoamylovorans]
MRRTYISLLLFGLLLIAILIGGYVWFKSKESSSVKVSFDSDNPDLLINTPNKIILIYENNGILTKGEIYNERFMHTSVYDKRTKKLLAPTYSPEHHFAGITEFSNGQAKYKKVKDFGPMNVVSYNGYLFMDSSLSLIDSEGIPITKLGLYDLRKNKFVKKFTVNGIVQSMIKVGNKVYFPSLCENSKSNIYRFDFDTWKLDKVLKMDQPHVPNQILFSKDMMIGLSNEEAAGASANKNKLYYIKNGEIFKELKLKQGTKEMAILDNKIMILYQPSGRKSFIEAFKIEGGQEAEKVKLADNPTNITAWNDNLVVIDQSKKIYIYNTEFQKINELELGTDSKVLNITKAN